MSKLYKKHRADVKKRWKQLGDVARPIGSHDEDWRKITAKWQQEFDDEQEILSSEHLKDNRTKAMKARDARKAVKYPHRTGSKSFHSRRSEYIMEFKQVLDEIEFFKQTQYREPVLDGVGDWISQDAMEAYEKIIQMHSESQSSSAPISSSDIVDKFMGATSRSDYYPGKGYGPHLLGSPLVEKS